MNYEQLRTFLPAFITVFIMALTLWTCMTKRKNGRIIGPSIKHRKEFKKIKRIETTFKILLAVFSGIIILYSLFPEYYKAFVGPIEALDHPFVNNMGVLILKISLASLVVAQLNIDRTIFKINQGLDEWHYLKLLSYSEKILLFSLLMMFIGVFVTISSLLSVVLCLFAAGVFLQLHKASIKPNRPH